jgi:phenylalanyl-tRNA synthetase alpha chain
MSVAAVKQLEAAALREVRQVQTPEALELLRVKYLGRKGDLTLVLRGLKDLNPELRRQVGREANQAKAALEAALAQAWPP